MNPNEISLISQYFSSSWAIWSHAFILIYLSLRCYDVYAKRWSAKTGEFQTSGTITLSNICQDGHGRSHANVEYSYQVGSQLFQSSIPAPKAKLSSFIYAYNQGANVPVYYAPRDPAFSAVNTPPSNTEIILSTVQTHLVFPFLVLHIASVLSFCIFTAS